MKSASGNVVRTGIEGMNRAGRKTGPFFAGLAGACGAFPRRKTRDRFAEDERATIGVPETVLRVDQDADGRNGHGFSAHRPALERQPRWTIEGEDDCASERAGDSAEDLAGPEIHRFRAGLRGCREAPPHGRTGVADHHDTRGVAAEAVAGVRCESTSSDQPVRLERLAD